MTEHIIFGISGRAQSGKTTLAEYVKKQIETKPGDSFETMLFPEYPYIKILSFADYLKKILADLFLVDDYYLNDDVGKTQVTQYRWRDLPSIMPNTSSIIMSSNAASLKLQFVDPNKYNEFMTGRELMEYFGAVFRQINPMAWVNGVVSQIKNTKDSTIFIIPDVRSANEIDAIKDLGGHVLRLMRDPLKRDSVIETALDAKNYDYNNFDFIINNCNISEEQKNAIGFEAFLNLTK